MKKKPSKTNTYLWQGKDSRGETVSGEIDAPNVVLAKSELRQRNIKPTKIKSKKPALFQFKSRINNHDITIFSRQLATMINSSIPIIQAFDVIIGGVNKVTLKELLLSIRNEISGGTHLASALSRHPQYFDELFCNLVNVGEESGTLDIMLLKVADYKERMNEIRAKIYKAMLYPVIVLIAALFITVGLMVFVVPTFEDLFKSFGGDLPTLTQFVISLSHLLRESWIFLSIVIAALIFFIRNLHKRSFKFKTQVDKLLLNIPVFGTLIKNASIARFSRTLAIMFSSGVPIVNALESVSGAVGNRIYRNETLLIRDSVITGQHLYESMRNPFLFPNMVKQMVSIGEESGSLDVMLNKIADFYEAEVNDTIDSLTTLLEPLIMIVLGLVIGGLVISIYLPIFQLGSVMQ